MLGRAFWICAGIVYLVQRGILGVLFRAFGWIMLIGLPLGLICAGFNWLGTRLFGPGSDGEYGAIGVVSIVVVYWLLVCVFDVGQKSRPVQFVPVKPEPTKIMTPLDAADAKRTAAYLAWKASK